MQEVNIVALNKIGALLNDYFSTPGAAPLNLAALMRMSPTWVQEGMFDLSLAYIRECTRGEMYSDTMKLNQETAQNISEWMTFLAED